MPSEKRLKHLARQQKKNVNTRTLEERTIEADKVKAKLIELGMTSEMPEVSRFIRILNDFVVSGVGVQGIIGVPGTGREIVYQLVNNKINDIGVMLRSNPNMK